MKESSSERSHLVAEVVDLLQKTDFDVSSRCTIKSTCFDLAARHQKLLFLLKILVNIDSLQKLHAIELKLLAKLLTASPLLVGQRCRRHEAIQDGVVYKRHGIPAVSPQTARDLLIKGLFPLIYASRGGLYVRLNSELLRSIREARKLSLAELAREIGVSRRTIYDYERGEMDASLETAIRLEKVLEIPIFPAIDFLKWDIEVEKLEKALLPESLEREVYERFEEIGLDPILLKTTPFDIFAPDLIAPAPERKFVNIMTAIDKGDETQSGKRIQTVKSVAAVTHSESLYVTEDDSIEQPFQGVATLSIQELEKIKEGKTLLRAIRKKSKITRNI